MNSIRELAIGIGTPAPTRTVIDSYGLETRERIWYDAQGFETNDKSIIEEIKQAADKVSAAIEYDHALSLYDAPRQIVKRLR